MIKKTIAGQLDLLLEGVAITGEQRAKFETIVSSIVNTEVTYSEAQLKESFVEREAELKATYADQLVESVEAADAKIDSYLSAVVDEWADDNKVALDDGLKSNRADSLIESLADILADHNVQIDGVDDSVIAAHEIKIAELTESLAAANANANLLKESADLAQAKIIVEKYTNGMADTNAEQFISLIENMEVDELFEDKVDAIGALFESKTGEQGDNGELLHESFGGHTPPSTPESIRAKYQDSILNPFGPLES